MKKQRNTNQRRDVAIELSPSALRLAVSTRSGLDQPRQIHTRVVNWREAAANVHSDAGKAELATALKQLVAEENLVGSKVRFTLSGDYCVTRVLSGTNERVRRELAQAKQRCQRYLTLGPGEKAVATSITPIDARHQHSLLAVANRKTLDALLHVADMAGIEIEFVEPSVVALCRVVGRLGHDAQEPVMLIDIDQKGAQLGISYQGQLLLDYRPGGHAVHEEIGEIIGQHLARLQRYCQRFLRFTGGPLTKVYLCAADGFADKALASFENLPAHGDNSADQLSVHSLDVEKIDPDAVFVDGKPNGDLAPAIGTCLMDHESPETNQGLNLLEGIKRRENQSWRREIVRLVSPLAAVLLVVIGMLAAVLERKHEYRLLEARLAKFDAPRGKSQELRLSLMQVEEKQKYWNQIHTNVANPAWSDLLSVVGGCLPPDVWLEQIRFDGQGQVGISGASFAEDGVFEFASWLEKSPPLADVALEGTKATQSRSAGAVGFDLKCALSNIDGFTREAGHGN